MATTQTPSRTTARRCELVTCTSKPASVRVRLAWNPRSTWDGDGSTERIVRERDLCPADARDKEQEFSKPGDLFEIIDTY